MLFNLQATLLELDRPNPLVWDLPAEKMSLGAPSFSFRDAQDELWWLMQEPAQNNLELYHLRDSRFMEWGEQEFGFSIEDDWFLNHLKSDAQGRLWLLRSGRLYLYEDGLWRFQASFAAPTPAYLLPTPSGRLFLGAAGALYEWTASGAVLRDTLAGSQLYISDVAEDADGTVWFRAESNPSSEVYRLQSTGLEKVSVAGDDQTNGFLDAHIMTVNGRLLMIRGADFWGYDKSQGRFVKMNSTDYAVPVDALTSVHALDSEQTLLQIINAEDSSQSLTLLSSRNSEMRSLPLLPGQRVLNFAIVDKDGLIWASDSGNEHIYCFHPGTGWTVVLEPGEMGKRLGRDSLRISDMIPAPEGGIFVQQYGRPLLRFLPPRLPN
jgi:hypothetical protein